MPLLCAYSAKPPVLVDSPLITAHSRQGIEQLVGIVLVLDFLQRFIIATPEGILPIRLSEIRFVTVRTAARRQCFELRHEVVRDGLLGYLVCRKVQGIPRSMSKECVSMTILSFSMSGVGRRILVQGE